jgi:hypothetical protein
MAKLWLVIFTRYLELHYVFSPSKQDKKGINYAEIETRD